MKHKIRLSCGNERYIFKLVRWIQKNKNLYEKTGERVRLG